MSERNGDIENPNKPESSGSDQPTPGVPTDRSDSSGSPEVQPLSAGTPDKAPTEASRSDAAGTPPEAEAVASTESEHSVAAPASENAESGAETGAESGSEQLGRSGYTGSPFHQSRYQGIRDAVLASERQQKRQRQGARLRRLGAVMTLVVGSVLGGVAGASFAVWQLTSEGLVTAGVTSPQTVTVNQVDDATLISAVAAQAMPSVVTLEVAGMGTAGSGSGVIISSEGHIITNAHVVSVGGAESNPRIRVSTTDGRLWSGEVVGSDPLSDIAVIKIDTGAGLTPIPLGDSDQLNVGDETVAIGAPLGLSNTVTNGIVSALNRSITVGSSETPEDGPNLFDFDLPFGQSGNVGTVSLPVIQTDASINPGNSGGALLNTKGELIGINVAIASNQVGSQGAGSIGLGFSIPSNYAMRVANELIATGDASHGLLGATVTDAAFDENASVSGAAIDSVSPGGAADKAGLRAGDIVTRFNGLPITNRIDLTAQVRTVPGGTETTLTYVRGSQSYTVRVTLDELP
ncbi:Stress response serine protease PepD [Pontimonas salivibrio]|uniref:Stress response serine protease PepD n=1 Tax=Pontimonas salivibrio TaxID=1159327 RepID=A0A2L2BS37_9MICO|nr:trypsin-like peptidase domain-containing protein [Pontimonas salivibrio]AVG24460.1 Stress response serine protease PepD [Pontimonas salivibrio]